MLPVDVNPHELNAAAEVLAKLNIGYSSANEAKKLIKSTIKEFSQTANHFKMDGFSLNFFKSKCGEGIHCRISIDVYSVLKYIEARQ